MDAEFRGELHGGRTPTISPRQGKSLLWSRWILVYAASSTHNGGDTKPFTFAWASILIITAPLWKGVLIVWMRIFALRLHD